MPRTPSRAAFTCFVQSLLGAFRPLHARGVLLDGPAHRPGPVPDLESVAATGHPLPLAAFLKRLRELLATSDETLRRRLENEVLQLAEPLHAAGVFKLVHIAHPAISAMVNDHLQAMEAVPRRSRRARPDDNATAYRHSLLP